MKTLFLVLIIIAIVIGITFAILGILNYRDNYIQNCETSGGFMTGFLSCTKIVKDFVTEEAMLADRYNSTLQEFHTPDEFSTGHVLARIGSNGMRTNLAEYFKQDSSILLFYEYCNCTKSKELLEDELTRTGSQILDVDGIPVIAYPRASSYANETRDEYVFEFYHNGYRISFHTDQQLGSGLILVKEILNYDD